MKYLRYALVFVFVVDVSIFLTSLVDPDLLFKLLPQFEVESTGYTYPRLVGVFFLMLGLARLYGATHITEKGAFSLSIWSWVVELIWTITEIVHGQFAASENLVALVVAPLMLVWSVSYFNKTFISADSE